MLRALAAPKVKTATARRLADGSFAMEAVEKPVTVI